MIPELGHFALILALMLAVLLAVVPMAGVVRRDLTLQHSAGALSAGLFVFLLLSYACLTQAFLQDDFSVAYVANNSNALLPWYY